MHGITNMTPRAMERRNAAAGTGLPKHGDCQRDQRFPPQVLADARRLVPMQRIIII